MNKTLVNNIDAACSAAGIVRNTLQIAAGAASPLENILISQHLETAAKLANDLGRIHAALREIAATTRLSGLVKMVKSAKDEVELGNAYEEIIGYNAFIEDGLTADDMRPMLLEHLVLQCENEGIEPASVGLEQTAAQINEVFGLRGGK
jgi:hypothetical protein